MNRIKLSVFGIVLMSSQLSAFADVTLTGADAEVVVAKGDAPAVRFAAAELTNFLSRAFGRTVPVTDAPHGGRKSILLGRAGAEAAGVDVKALATDEFVVRTIGTDRVALVGRDHPTRDPAREHRNGAECRFDRATLFAAYDFLEREVGCRFYFPGELGECVPRTDRVTVRSGERRVKPAYQIRHWYDGGSSTWFEGDKGELNRVRGLNMLRLRMETEPIPCCHGQNAFRYVERFGKTHPEYFLKKADGTRFNCADAPGCSKFGQICYSSGAMEELYQDVKAYLTGQPASSRGLKAWGYNCVGGKYVDIMSNDAFFPCHCGKCGPRASKTDKLDYATEMVWEETVKIANRLTAEGVKGYVTQMAYNPYRRIPDFDIPTNVLVMVAETGPWCTTDKAKAARDNDEIRRWSEKLGRPVWIWTYPGKYPPQSYPGIPQQTPRAIANYYKQVSPWIFGTFMESETDRYLYNHLNYYMLSRVAWDPSFDVDATLAEYYRLMFGPAADVMKAFFEDLERKWLTGIVGNIMDTVEGPKVVQPPDGDIWNKVYTADFLARQRAALTPFASGGTLEARRVKLFLDEYLKPLEEQSAEFLKRQAGVARLAYASGGAPMSLVPFRIGKSGEPVRTEVTLSRGKDALVIDYRCWEPRMDETKYIAAGHNDSGTNWKNNGIELFLNVSGDRQNYYQLVVSENGEYDQLLMRQLGNGQRQPQCLGRWDSRATVKTGRFDGGYTLEISIPLASFAERVPESFPANFCRNRILKDNTTFDLYSWSPYAKGYHDPLAFGRVSLVSEGDLRDHCWMWGHDSGRYDGRGNKYNIPTSEPISMADACAYMGIPNVCAVTWNEPSDEYLKPFAKLKRVSWVACGEKRQDQDVLRERAFRLAEKLPNLMGLDLDDYFISKDLETVMTPKGEVKVTKSVIGHANLLALRKRVDDYGRPLELRMVVYLGNPEMPSYAPALREMDTILLWTWDGENLAKLRENFAEFRKAAPQAKVLLGVYMWDFGGCKPLDMKFMRAQLDVAHELYMSREIDGFIFHCTPLVNKSPKLEAVEYARDWIARHAHEVR